MQSNKQTNKNVSSLKLKIKVDIYFLGWLSNRAKSRTFKERSFLSLSKSEPLTQRHLTSTFVSLNDACEEISFSPL